MNVIPPQALLGEAWQSRVVEGHYAHKSTPSPFVHLHPYGGPMHSRFESLPNRRAIVDRRALAEQVAALGITGPQGRTLVTPVLRAALDAGRREVARRLSLHPSRGLEAAAAQAYLTDQVLKVLFDFTTDTLYPLSNPTAGERLTLIAVGGYGRGEMAPIRTSISASSRRSNRRPMPSRSSNRCSIRSGTWG